MGVKHLLEPIRIGHMEVRNRIVMPPIMGPGFATGGGVVSETRISYHETQAKGGVGLIITGGATIDPLMAHSTLHIGLWHDKFIPGLTELANAVHLHGARLAPQVMHQGARRDPQLAGAQSVSPSPTPPKEKWLSTVPRELTMEEIEEIVEEFGEAARRAREASCDAIELHAAHGRHNLISAFLSPMCNKRSDVYGGSTEGRLRIALEIIRRMKAKAGNDFPVIVRLSGDELVPGGRTLLETELMAPLLVEAGADALHITGGSFPELSWWVMPPAGTPIGLNVAAAAVIKRSASVPVIVAGRINDPLLAGHIVASDKADLVGMGRALIADPELPNKAAAGAFDDIAPCIGCNLGCVDGARRLGFMTCLINPTVGREKQMLLVRAKKSRKVVVIGGGPGGMHAAWVAAVRGHDVTLFEKTPRLGGQFNLAAVPPLMQENVLLVKYLARQVQKAGVRIELESEVTTRLIKQIGPDAVVVATGGVPLVPGSIPGADRDNVRTAHDVLAGRVVVKSGNVLVIGGGIVGCEAADFVAETEDNLLVGPTSVTILEELEAVAQDMQVEARHLLLQSLRQKGVKWITGACVSEISDDGAVYVKDGENHTLRGMDYIILALGARPAGDLARDLEGMVPELYVIGDAKEPRTALEAITEAAEVGRVI